MQADLIATFNQECDSLIFFMDVAIGHANYCRNTYSTLISGIDAGVVKRGELYRTFVLLYDAVGRCRHAFCL